MRYYKDGVKIAGVRPEILIGLDIAEEIYKGRTLPMWVTSVTDGQHMNGSLHYKGLAADLRTKGTGSASPLCNDLKKALNPLGFDVILEDLEGDNEHIHIEFDPKA